MKNPIPGWLDAIRTETRERLAIVSRFFRARTAAFKALPLWKKVAVTVAGITSFVLLGWCL